MDGARRDAVSGAILHGYTTYLRLAHPSGKPVPLEQQKPLPDVAASAPPPAAKSDCLRGLETARQRFTELKAAQAERVYPAEQFAQGAPNPQLTARMQAVVSRILAAVDRSWAPQVECHDRVCRIVVPGVMIGRPLNDWLTPIGRDPEFRQLTTDPKDVGAQGVFVPMIDDPTRPMVALGPLVEAWKGSPGLAACTAKFPDDVGRLVANFELSDGVRPPPGTGPGTLSVAWTGSLADSDLGHCVQDSANAFIATTKFPAKVRAGAREITLDFPLPPSL
jgi:hypothetical protein